jgi:hypothetical protein
VDSRSRFPAVRAILTGDEGEAMGRWGRGGTDAKGGRAASRQTAARISDLRLWAGISLLVVSGVVGARVVSAHDETVTVWRATGDLSAGAPATGLEAVGVPVSVAAGGYARPGDSLEGVLRFPVAAGQLLPDDALRVATRPAQREVTVPVDPLHAPVNLEPGDVVDVWTMPRDDTAMAEPAAVLRSAVVASVSADGLGIGGELGVVLSVVEADVPRLVAAARVGVLDLVAVPLGSQVPAA